MDFGSLELQIFVSLVVVLGAAFVALVCDYLKGNNEQLREKNIEMRVRREELERRQLLDPAAAVNAAVVLEQFSKIADSLTQTARKTPAQAEKPAAKPHEVMNSFAAPEALEEVRKRSEAMSSRRPSRRNRGDGSEVPADGQEILNRFVSGATMARVAARQNREQTPAEPPNPVVEPSPESSIAEAPPEEREIAPVSEAMKPGGWGIRAAFERVSARRSRAKDISSGLDSHQDHRSGDPRVPSFAGAPEPRQEQVVNQEVQTLHLDSSGGRLWAESRTAAVNPPVNSALVHTESEAPSGEVTAPASLALLDQIIEVSSSRRQALPRGPELAAANQIPTLGPDGRGLDEPPSVMEIFFSGPAAAAHAAPASQLAGGEKPVFVAPESGSGSHFDPPIPLETPVFLQTPAPAPRPVSLPDRPSEAAAQLPELFTSSFSRPTRDSVLVDLPVEFGVPGPPSQLSGFNPQPAQSRDSGDDLGFFGRTTLEAVPGLSPAALPAIPLVEPETEVTLDVTPAEDSSFFSSFSLTPKVLSALEYPLGPSAPQPTPIAPPPPAPEPAVISDEDKYGFYNSLTPTRPRGAETRRPKTSDPADQKPADFKPVVTFDDPAPAISAPPAYGAAPESAFGQAQTQNSGLPEVRPPSGIAVNDAQPGIDEPAPELLLPTGMHGRDVLSRLAESANPMSGVVIAIGLNDFKKVQEAHTKPQFDELAKSIDKLMSSLLREQDFGAQHADGEWIFIYRNETGSSAQRRINNVSERLWDFQLRSLGAVSILFSWGAVEVESEKLGDAIKASIERMEQTRRGRKNVPMGAKKALSNERR